MTACSFNFFILLTVYLSLIFHPSHGFMVIQPQYQTVNPDGSASISCEHTANVSSVADVRLTSISLNPSERSVLCQKGKKDCKNITMYRENPNKYLFILLNIGPEAMNMTYECEFTVTKGRLDYTNNGRPTTLRAGLSTGQNKTEDWVPRLPQPPHCYELIWIPIGLLVLIFLYSCVITSVYIKLRVTKTNSELENSTYVEMRKAPLTVNPPVGIYCG
ncbi:uncharacterized protein [Trachinotus anak]|uniref:uncharacterized protein n=1 Tax=Trachinotus anak TaxID=443729 RepID=UPI0039F17EEE